MADVAHCERPLLFNFNPLNPDLYKAYRSPTLSYLHKFCKISLPK